MAPGIGDWQTPFDCPLPLAPQPAFVRGEPTSAGRSWLRRGVALLMIAAIAGWSVALAQGDEVAEAIQAVGRVGPEGAGAAEARRARDLLAAQDATVLPRLLDAMDTTNVLAANWYRTAFDAIAAGELKRPQPRIPREELLAFVKNSQKSGRPRRLGFALLQQLDPQLAEQLIPAWLDDPEFRRDSVAWMLQHGDSALKAQHRQEAVDFFTRGFRHARDADQVQLAVQKLQGVGVTANPVEHLGFQIQWQVVGPFPAEQMTGFRRSFPPESAVDLQAEYALADGQKLRWKSVVTSHLLGEVNLIQSLGAVREAVAYAYTELDSPREQSVQLRCSADDNLTVWLNGRQVLAREQWLNGTRLDRFSVPVTLQSGVNRVLVKICQGPQHVNPEVPNNWTFQLRFCDETGGGVQLPPRALAAP